MKVLNIDILTDYNIPKCEAICIGKFDGLHYGHMELIKKCSDLSSNFGIMTFDPLPFIFFKKGSKVIYSKHETLENLQNLGTKFVYIVKFNTTLQQTSGDTFIQKVSQISQNIIVGSDFKCGHNQEYDIQKIQKLETIFNFKLHIVDQITQDNQKISSSLLKHYIQTGDFQGYMNYSPVHFYVNGTVQHGRKLAHQIGFATANVMVDELKTMPPFGVYAVIVFIKNTKHYGIANWGIKPTITEEKLPLLEIHIFDFNQNIYNININTQFITKIRNEIKFQSINDLKNQIEQDIKTCKEFFSKYENHKT